MLRGDRKDGQVPLSEWFLKTSASPEGVPKDFVGHRWDGLAPHGTAFAHFGRTCLDAGVWGTAGAADEPAGRGIGERWAGCSGAEASLGPDEARRGLVWGEQNKLREPRAA